MAVRCSPYPFLFIFLFITYLVVNQYQSVPTVKHLNLDSDNLFPQAKKVTSLINRGQNIVNQFRCRKGWKQFGGSCYYPSTMKSTVDKANQTCSLLHVNNTHLMRIRHAVELAYAAHLFFTKNLTTLLVETDPRLFKSQMFMDIVSANNRAEWQMIEPKLYQAPFAFKKPKAKSFDPTTSSEDDEIDLSDEDKKDDFEWFDQIRGLCHQFAWNVLNKDSHMFTFTTYQIWDKMICSLSDVDLDTTYEHACQYVFDFCFGHAMCKHGQCVNSHEGFKCACSFFFDGVLCENFSRQILQMILAVIIIVVLGSFLLIKKVCSVRQPASQSITQCCDREETKTNDEHNEKNTTSNDERFCKALKETPCTEGLHAIASVSDIIARNE